MLSLSLVRCDRPVEKGGTGERGRNGTSGDLVRPLSPSRLSSTVQGSFDLYALPMWPTPSNVVPFLERQSGNACLIIYAAQVAWNFTVSYVILAHAFSRAWTRDHVSAHIRAYTHEASQYRLDDTVYMRECVCICLYVCVCVCVQVGGSCQGNSILRA